MVLLVFHNVDPSDFRRLKKHWLSIREGCGITEKLQKWKMALYRVANLCGYHFKHGYPHLTSLDEIFKTSFRRRKCKKNKIKLISSQIKNNFLLINL